MLKNNFTSFLWKVIFLYIDFKTGRVFVVVIVVCFFLTSACWKYYSFAFWNSVFVWTYQLPVSYVTFWEEYAIPIPPPPSLTTFKMSFCIWLGVLPMMCLSVLLLCSFAECLPRFWNSNFVYFFNFVQFLALILSNIS